MKKIFCTANLFLCLVGSAQASITTQAFSLPAQFTGTTIINGNIANQTDVVRYDFSLTQSTKVTLTTDSRAFYAPEILKYNFDPLLTLWDASGNFIADNDDIDTTGFLNGAGVNYNASIAGLDLASGNYFFTISASNNSAANAETGYAGGFAFDNPSANQYQTPTAPGLSNAIPLADWNQQLSAFDTNTYPNPAGTPLGFYHGPGGTYNINFTAAAVTAIPLPASIWLFCSALMGMLLSKRKKH